jgi:hypothetical protein
MAGAGAVVRSRKKIGNPAPAHCSCSCTCTLLLLLHLLPVIGQYDHCVDYRENRSL